jgi:hypothetical protein
MLSKSEYETWCCTGGDIFLVANKLVVLFLWYASDGWTDANVCRYTWDVSI